MEPTVTATITFFSIVGIYVLYKIIKAKTKERNTPTTTGGSKKNLKNK